MEILLDRGGKYMFNWIYQQNKEKKMKRAIEKGGKENKKKGLDRGKETGKMWKISTRFAWGWNWRTFYETATTAQKNIWRTVRTASGKSRAIGKTYNSLVCIGIYIYVFIRRREKSDSAGRVKVVDKRIDPLATREFPQDNTKHTIIFCIVNALVLWMYVHFKKIFLFFSFIRLNLNKQEFILHVRRNNLKKKTRCPEIFETDGQKI